MCMSSPDIPDAPPPTQPVKQPESVALSRAKRNSSTMAGGTLLTGPSGIAQAALNTGAPTLLGG